MVKELIAPDGVFFDREEMSDEYGLKMAKAWVDAQLRCRSR